MYIYNYVKMFCVRFVNQRYNSIQFCTCLSIYPMMIKAVLHYQPYHILVCPFSQIMKILSNVTDKEMQYLNGKCLHFSFWDIWNIGIKMHDKFGICHSVKHSYPKCVCQMGKRSATFINKFWSHIFLLIKEFNATALHMGTVTY